MGRKEDIDWATVAANVMSSMHVSMDLQSKGLFGRTLERQLMRSAERELRDEDDPDAFISKPHPFYYALQRIYFRFYDEVNTIIETLNLLRNKEGDWPDIKTERDILGFIFEGGLTVALYQCYAIGHLYVCSYGGDLMNLDVFKMCDYVTRYRWAENRDESGL